MDIILMLFQTALALGAVCGLAYVIFRVVLPRLNAVPTANNSMMRVVDRAWLEQRKALYVIEVAGRWFLVATSETGVQLVSELDSVAASEAEERLRLARQQNELKFSTEAVRRAFADKLAKVMNKKGERK